MNEHDFFEVLGYLSNPRRQCKLDAEMHPRTQQRFESRYAGFAGLVPQPDNHNYYILHPDADKRGIELRIYFYAESDSIPLAIREMVVTPRLGRIYNQRINNNDFIWRLIEYGFCLGDGQDEDRIRAQIPSLFVDDFDRGYQAI